MFQGKRILFFSANFFGYQNEIRRKLTEMGGEVDFFDERPKNTFWYKALIRIDKRLMNKRISAYYHQIIENTRANRYDYVFFLKAEVITVQKMERLKAAHPEAVFLLYMWDSIRNCPSVTGLFPFFDRIYSFDRKDVLANEQLRFRPLFYLDDYAGIPAVSSPKYEISFIGTGHSDRYKLVMQVKRICEEKGWKAFLFLYLQDIRVFYYRKIATPGFRKARKGDFSFKPLGKEDILEHIRDTRCVLDIERPVQVGLTMRTIEVLGARRKLITTNADIVHYDFYNPENILIIDRKDPEIPDSFVHAPYTPVKEEVYASYSIGAWVREIFMEQ